MGGALVKGVVARGVCDPADVFLYDVHAASAAKLAADLDGAVVAESLQEAIESADVVFICVKPHDVRAVLEEAGDTQGDPLFVSIAAGIALADLEAALGGRRRVVRVMPNTPALVGEGASAYVVGELATREDARTVELLLSSVGVVEAIPERLMDAVTGVSGSGPAYIYTVIEAMADGGVRMGLPREKALRLAAQTVRGAAAMVLETGEHPAVLRDMVTSPGGTTIAALAELEARGLRSSLIEAVRAAAVRSGELGRPPGR